MCKRIAKKSVSLLLVLALLASSILFSAVVVSADDNGSHTPAALELPADGETATKELYSLIDHSFFNSGNPAGGTVYLPRGDDHDRQHLGIFLKTGDTLTIKLSGEAIPDSELILDLLANDQTVENIGESPAIPNDKSAVTVTAQFDCVPMIRTPADDNGTVYSVDFSVSTVRKLPDFVKGGDQEAFFAEWDESKATYGMVESDRVMMLIPYADRWRLCSKNSTDSANDQKYKFTKLDDMLTYFDNMLEQYDRFVGLDKSENADPWNRWVPSKYLLKLDNHGAGLAYYCDNYVAMNGQATNNSIDNYFFMPDWLNTHELGHGYGVVFAGSDSSKPDVTEVWNNIYGYYYELLTKDEADFWLPRTEERLTRYENNRVNYGYYGSPDDLYGDYYADMLFFWVNLFDLDPEKLMSELNRRYREDVYKGNARNYSGADLYAKYLMEISGYNLIPYFEAWGLNISDSLEDSIVKSGKYKNISSLRFFTASDAQADALIKNIDFDSVKDRYSLVPTELLADSGFKGTIKININIDDISELRGKTIRITDGVNTVATPEITGRTITAEVPIGSYNVIMPGSDSGHYAVNDQYQLATVSTNSECELNAEYSISNGNFLSDYTIRYLGLADAEYFNASYSLDSGKMTIKRTNGEPHYYFNDEFNANPYSSFEVIDAEGKVVFSDVQKGNERKAIDEVIDIKPGYLVKIMHKEPFGRLKIESTAISNLDYSEFSHYPTVSNLQSQEPAPVMTYRITEYGLEPVENISYSNAKNGQEAYMNRLKAYFNDLIANNPADVWSNPDEFVAQKANIIGGVQNKLTESEAESFKNTFVGVYGLFDNGTDLAEKSDLKAKMNEARTALSNAVGELKRAALDNAISSAQEVLDADDPTPEEIAEALYALSTAIEMDDDGIENPQDDDKTALDKKIKEAEAAYNDVPTTNVLKQQALELAISKGYSVMENPDATKEEIKDAIKALNEALAMPNDGGSVIVPESLLGDVNADTQINATDATLILQFFAKIITESTNGYYNKVADVDGNKLVDASDATYVLQHFAKIITEFPGTAPLI